PLSSPLSVPLSVRPSRPVSPPQTLKQQRDKLRQYQKRLSLGLERERALARQLLRDGKKEKALLLLKKKRYQEQLLDKTENQISNLERMVQDIEFTQIEMKVIEGLKIGNECLNKMHQVMSIEEVERIIGETQDAVEYQRVSTGGAGTALLCTGQGWVLYPRATRLGM
uniref:Charged multivesicular body protein 6 n=1 Tax=Zosterops lateralis melanops TaxID=1220523 RepID=A0A8D2QLX1_ZOSLA